MPPGRRHAAFPAPPGWAPQRIGCHASELPTQITASAGDSLSIGASKLRTVQLSPGRLAEVMSSPVNHRGTHVRTAYLQAPIVKHRRVVPCAAGDIHDTAARHDQRTGGGRTALLEPIAWANQRAIRRRRSNHQTVGAS